MEEVLLSNVLNLRNKSFFTTWVEGEKRGKERKGHSISVVTINRVSQFSNQFSI